ncbi:hypothetical protein CYMTET_29537 [Cymbomonas tetramitiformis]|uniref:Uncharacterized protein n=1 Tax=Cymbomonas tetramitiformis TaxID=36881 RepID=A0AAE0FMA3_9CHLO|nr:hypothetical protein CYMTET_29537 [Cymbomonas tetramitiformis]
MEELPLSVTLTNAKQSALRLNKFKHGATTSAIEWREDLLEALCKAPHAFGGEMEWGVQPATCPTVTPHARDDVPLDTLDGLMDADLPLDALEGYLMYLRGSAIVWHAHLRKMPDFRAGQVLDPRTDGWLEWRATERATSQTTNDSLQPRRGVFEKAGDVFNGNFTTDVVQHATSTSQVLRCGEGPLSKLHLSLPQPAEAPAPEYCDLVRGVDGRLSAHEPMKHSKAEFAYRLI